MGSYTFRWPYNANEVFVTGSFDDWGKTVKLDRTGDVFEKEVRLPSIGDKVQYKFVVDGIWTTDSNSREENDGSNNINNVLLPEDINAASHAAVMSGVTPNSTTAALAAQVPKEGGDTTVNSAAPDSTSAEQAKQSLQEQSGGVPGSFPETPARDSGDFSVNPIPASSGIGNPTQLRPGEKVPDTSAVSGNTIQSTVRTDKAGYEADASAPFVGGAQAPGANDLTLPTESKNLIPESSLPMGESRPADPGYTIQSAGPASTTAALAAGVPLESQKQQPSGETPVEEVPAVVRESMAEAHKDPEAAASHEAVSEKEEVEKELHQKVKVDESSGAPAPTATAATTETAPRQPDSAQLSPRSTTPTQPTVTTGVGEAKAPPTSAGAGAATGTTTGKGDKPGAQGNGPESKKKRKSRTSGFFSKLKDVFK